MSPNYIFALGPFFTVYLRVRKKFQGHMPTKIVVRINGSHGWEYRDMAIALRSYREIFECQVKFLHVTPEFGVCKAPKKTTMLTS